MQRTYEVMYIIRPDLTDEDVEKLVSTMDSNATAAGGTLVKDTERMGKRRLAYIVRGFQDGMYVLMTIKADGKAIHEVERRLRVTEPVVKFMAVRVEEHLKRLDKMKALRASKVKRSTAEAPPAAVATPEIAPEQAPAV
jgi:small subunit ribosomal protein S6